MFQTIGSTVDRERKPISAEMLRGLLSLLGGIIAIGLLVLLITLSG
ncbi:MAG TPA: hypothetical protein VN577_18385 [Terriglobales bacterium]|nr:hypothetical protein [Terriglobales bacterium]